ncbi:MAG TPA: hypothetical protein ENK37_03470, partial [Oceanithermus profundus]|nr:hypothetical protein [Oceanithermus profundus]
VELGAWERRTYDRNDTATGSAWYASRIGYGGSDPEQLAEQRAAASTEAHADTPLTEVLDALGRVFLLRAHNGDDGGPLLYDTHLTLDVEGNLLAVTDARGNEAEARSFGMAGQSLEVRSVDAGARQGLADVGGGLLRAFDARGQSFRATYDALRRPVERYVDAGGGERLLDRVAYGELLAAPKATNHLGRVLRVYDGAGEQAVTAYDFRGHPLAATRRLAADPSARPDWSPLAGLSSLADLDAAAAPLLEAEVFATATTYDALARPVTATAPDGAVVTTAYGAGGLLESVTVTHASGGATETVVSDMDYDAKGRRLSVVHGNGTSTTYAYDPLTSRLRRITTTRASDSAVLQDLRHTHDPVGNLTEVRDLAQQSVYFNNAAVHPGHAYTYDPLYRLTRATGREQTSAGSFGPQDTPTGPQPGDPSALQTYTQDYTYDPTGNLLQLRHAANSGSYTRNYHYTPDGNRLLETSEGTGATFPDTYTHDPHGNLTSMPHIAALVWDPDDQLQQATPGSQTVSFQYDAAGQRVRKFVEHTGTTTDERVYIGGWEVYRRRTGAGATLQTERTTLHVADDTDRLLLVETLTVDSATPVPAPTPVRRHQLTDHLGSAHTELDAAGNVFAYEEYHPYGTTAYRAHDTALDVSPRRYRYTGTERDEETGLYAMGARYYAPWLGRWTAADPIGLGDGVNRYAYVRGNPVRLRDPGGMTAGGPEQKIDFEEPEVVVGSTIAPGEVREGETRKEFAGRVIQERFAGIDPAERAVIETELPEGAGIAEQDFQPGAKGGVAIPPEKAAEFQRRFGAVPRAVGERIAPGLVSGEATEQVASDTARLAEIAALGLGAIEAAQLASGLGLGAALRAAKGLARRGLAKAGDIAETGIRKLKGARGEIDRGIASAKSRVKRLLGFGEEAESDAGLEFGSKLDFLFN